MKRCGLIKNKYSSIKILLLLFIIFLSVQCFVSCSNDDVVSTVSNTPAITSSPICLTAKPTATIEATYSQTATATIIATPTAKATSTLTHTTTPTMSSTIIATPTVTTTPIVVSAIPIKTATPSPNHTEEVSVATSSPQIDVATPISEIVINEVMVLNDWYLKQSDGKFYDWVEIKNVSNNDIELSDYIITDKKNKMKYTLPNVTLKPDNLYVVICSDNSTGFALNSTADDLYLYNKSGVIIDSVHLENIPYGYSYGRMDSIEGLYYFTKPTPLENNTSGVKEISSEATSNYSSGVYNLKSISLTLSSEGTIYFTTDGTEPTLKSQIFSNPITISKNTIIRTLVQEKGKLPSKITTFSYILNPDTTLPVLSLVTAPDNLWDDEIGIYVKGNYDNYFQDWERAASFSYFGEDGTFSINCGLKLNGEGSRESDAKKSFRVLFKGKYGASELKYNLFNNGINEYDSLVIRAGEDYRYSVFRNEMIVKYAQKYFPSLVVRDGKYCSLYINGEYFGIYYLMERITEKLISEKYDVPEDEIIIEDFKPETDGELEAIMNFCLNNDMSLKQNYDYITSKIDIESMTDWYILEAYSGNTDVTQNIKYVKLGNNGKWKWVAHDFDWSFYFHDTPFEKVLVAKLWYTSYIIKPMLKNAEYKQYFIERFAYHAKNTLNEPTKMTNIIDELYAIIEPEIAKERARWGGTVESWNKYVNDIKSFVVDHNRCQELIDSIISVFSLSQEEINKYFG